MLAELRRRMNDFTIVKIVIVLLTLNWMVPTTIAQTESPAASPSASMAEFCSNQPRPAYASLSRLESDDDWFQLYRIAPGVTAIYEPHQWQEVISYLIEGQESALLFDSGNGIADISRVVAKLTVKPVMLLNSHSHYDHVGGNFSFTEIYGLDTDFTRSRQAGIDNSDIKIEVSPPALCRELPKGVGEENHIGRPYQVKHLIKDGHQFDLGGRQLEVMSVPGHTPDAIALIDREAGLMWTGDSYYSGPIWLYAPETDLAAYKKSLERMAAELPNLKALLPAHNTPWVEPQVLKRLQVGFDELLAGKLRAQPQDDGTVIYEIEGESQFSFLLSEQVQ